MGCAGIWDLVDWASVHSPFGWATMLGRDGTLFEELPEQPAPERKPGGKPRLRMAERRQVELRPVALDDLVPEDHRVRMVWRFAEGLDLSALSADIKAVEGRPGHPPADPRILVALWLYATRSEEHTSELQSRQY